jgi:predicted ATPase/DNA-binding SARP family transcriptional activator
VPLTPGSQLPESASATLDENQRVRIAVLGALEVLDDDGVPVEVAGARLRTLLILLVMAGGGGTGTDRLVDGSWGERPPAGAVNALQALVSRLRRTLPGAVIEARPAGYRMVVEPDTVDVTRFEQLVERGRAALADDPATASVTLRAALELWRGPALADAAGASFTAAAVARLDELRLSAIEGRIEADLRLGRGAQLVTELSALVAEHPLRERLVGALMRALTAAGRPAEALTVFERAKAVLAGELGTDPSPELSAVHLSVLRAPARIPARTNLRAALTSFVGRDEDLATVRALVGEYRLTTLTGPGGSGKTRLSVEAARGLHEWLPDGVWFVELAPVGDGADVPQAVLAALGVRDQVLGGPVEGEPVDRLAAALGTRRVLLVLDNCEHVVDAVAELADRLLGECPRLRILATSREPLGITGEALWPVEPLALPPDGAGDALSYAAVRLLADRARAVRPGFTVGDDAAAVTRICRALDGMPLAIELAAARLRTMSAAQLAARLDDRFRLLTGGSRVALPRHQTLRAVVDWSWELLSEEERVLWRRLAVFAGGATQETAERVCAGGPVAADRVLPLLTALAEKSLLVVADGERYRMLETIRAYGLERLDEVGEREQVRQAHAACFVELTEWIEPRLRRRDQLVWLDRLKAEHDNLTSAIRAAVAAGDASTAVRLVAAAGWYWWMGGHKAEGASLADEALSVQGEVADEPRATAYAIAALLALDGLRDEQRAGRWFRTAHELSLRTTLSHPLLRLLDPIEHVVNAYRRPEPEFPPADVIGPLVDDEDPWVRGTARSMRGHLRLNQGRHTAAAEDDFVAALAEYHKTGERWGISFTLTSLADLVAWRGDFATAIEYHEQALAAIEPMLSSDDVVRIRVKLARLHYLTGDLAAGAATLAEADAEAEHLGLPEALGSVTHAKGDFARWAGDLAAAHDHLTRALAIARHVTVAPQFRAQILDSLGYAAALTGDLATARDHHAESLGWAVDSIDAPVVAQALVGVAHFALCQDQPAEAATLMAASTVVRGAPDLSHVDSTRVTARIRAALTGEELAAAGRKAADTTIFTAPGLVASILGTTVHTRQMLLG